MIIKRLDGLTIDENWRFCLSKEERAKFGNSLIIMGSKDKLLLLTEQEWQELENKTLLGLKGQEFRKSKRALGNSAFVQPIDKKGRLLIPEKLRSKIKQKSSF